MAVTAMVDEPEVIEAIKVPELLPVLSALLTGVVDPVLD
jgi:hypothetical protein